MMRTALAMILTAVVGVGVFARDDEAEKPKGDNPDDAPRLKKKKRADVPPPPPVKEEKDKAEKDKDKVEKDRAEKDKDRAKVEKGKKDKEKKAKDKEDDFVPEDGPMGEEREDEQDVLKRVGDNMRGVEDKLGNREVGDPTQQQQRDIIKDLDDLINRSQQQEQGGGGANQQQQNPDQDQDQQQQKQGQQQQKQKAGQKKQQKQGQQQQQRAQRQPRQQRQQQQMAKNDKKEQGEKKEDNGGQDGGKGKTGEGETGKIDDKREQLRDVWGHLPESLRAEMNAYSNPRPFMPRYDDLIKKYYRTIAEQGRKKGD
jgi:hypothetical protein